jgi:oxygen-independent coproporphyrinogen-3 oxidase
MDLISSAVCWPVPRAAYIHVPFCRHRCGYCNFSVVADRDDLIERFLVAIDRELAGWSRPAVDSVFLGGGTPSHLGAEQLDRLLHLVRARLELEPSVEWSIEANPEDITSQRLDVLVRHGVNRISLGVQSFEPQKLSTLQRGHSGEAARESIVAAAQRIGSVSIDLIFAAPGEDMAVWQRDLETALALPIGHLSSYALTFEKGANFWGRRRRGELCPASETTEIEMYQLARTLTAAAGWEHYEISNFARPGARCRHNLAYWDGRGWYAAGPGAARFVGGRREVNHRSTTTYLRRIEAGLDPTAESEPISVEQYARERAAFGIRMIEGIDLAEIEGSCGVPLRQRCCAAIQRSLREGLVHSSGTHLRLSEQGILFADTVAARFLS